MTLYPQLKILVCQHPDLERYRRQLFGSCCRSLTDQQVQERVSRFLMTFPRFKDILDPLVSTPLG